MSLDNIQLPPIVLEQLFNKSLIAVEIQQPALVAAPLKPVNMLGENKRGVLILVNYNETVFLPENELNFLIGILSACKLTMEDVGIVNLAKSKQLNYQSIQKEISCNILLMFGVLPKAIEMPLDFPYYQLQNYNNHTHLCAPCLSALMNDKTEKGKLWTSLKQLFSI